jgi:hypothetical protein
MMDSLTVEAKIDALSQGRLLDPGGTWRGFFHAAGTKSSTVPSETIFYSVGSQYAAYVWPFAKRGMRKLIRNIDDSYPHFPIKLYGNQDLNYGPSQCYGVLDGLRAISGFNNQQENTFVDDGKDFLVCRSANETAIEDYVAMELG